MIVILGYIRWLMDDPRSSTLPDLASGSKNCGYGARKQSVLARCIVGVMVLFGVIAILRYDNELAYALARLFGNH